MVKYRALYCPASPPSVSSKNEIDQAWANDFYAGTSLDEMDSVSWATNPHYYEEVAEQEGNYANNMADEKNERDSDNETSTTLSWFVSKHFDRHGPAGLPTFDQEQQRQASFSSKDLKAIVSPFSAEMREDTFSLVLANDMKELSCDEVPLWKSFTYDDDISYQPPPFDNEVLTMLAEKSKARKEAATSSATHSSRQFQCGSKITIHDATAGELLQKDYYKDSKVDVHRCTSEYCQSCQDRQSKMHFSKTRFIPVRQDTSKIENISYSSLGCVNPSCWPGPTMARFPDSWRNRSGFNRKRCQMIRDGINLNDPDNAHLWMKPWCGDYYDHMQESGLSTSLTSSDSTISSRRVLDEDEDEEGSELNSSFSFSWLLMEEACVQFSKNAATVCSETLSTVSSDSSCSLLHTGRAESSEDEELRKDKVDDEDSILKILVERPATFVKDFLSQTYETEFPEPHKKTVRPSNYTNLPSSNMEDDERRESPFKYPVTSMKGQQVSEERQEEDPNTDLSLLWRDFMTEMDDLSSSPFEGLEEKSWFHS